MIPEQRGSTQTPLSFTAPAIPAMVHERVVYIPLLLSSCLLQPPVASYEVGDSHPLNTKTNFTIASQGDERRAYPSVFGEQ